MITLSFDCVVHNKVYPVHKRSHIFWAKELITLPADIAQELKETEESAKKLVEEAKSKANGIIEEARVKAEEIIKEAKAKARAQYREIVQQAQAEAEKKAQSIIEQGKKKISSERETYLPKVDHVAALVMEEVMKTYGNN